MKTVRLILDDTQSDVLRASGSAFAVVAAGSHPDAVGRMVLHLMPIDKPTAEAAISVALGKATARRRKGGKA